MTSMTTSFTPNVFTYKECYLLCIKEKRKMKTFVVPILSVFVLLSGVSGEKYL